MANDLISGQINFTGLGSGTDFNTVTDKLIEIEGAYKTKLESWKAEWELKVVALQDLNTALQTLKSTLQGMDTMQEFLVKNVTSSESTILTATADASADEASHSIMVNRLATNSIWMSTMGVTDSAADLNSNATSFVYTYDEPNDGQGPLTISNAVPAGASLDDLINIINANSANPGVRAAKLYDGENYYLQIRGLDLGSEAELNIDTGSFYDLGTFTETQSNANAQIRVNGWPASGWIEAGTNSISTAVEGMTLNLQSAGNSPPAQATITANTDTAAVKSNIETVVGQINQVRALFKEMMKFDTDTQQGSIMTGNYAVQLVDSRFKQTVAQIGQGFLRYDDDDPRNTDLYSTLSQVGILTDAEDGSLTRGLLIIDDTILDEALKDNPDAVAQLFSADLIYGQQTDGAANFSYTSHIDGITKPGTYEVEYSISGGVITSATINGHEAAIDPATRTLTAVMPDEDEVGMVVKVNDTTQDGDFTGRVRLKQGKAGELIDLMDELTNEESGPLFILEENYGNIIDNISHRIDTETVRLANRAQFMREKFARLEALLSEYNQQSTSLNSQISQLSSS